MENKLELALGGIVLASIFFLGGCYRRAYNFRYSSDRSLQHREYRRPTRRVITRRPYRVGLPRRATPQNIQRKFRRDVEYLRRTRKR